jgi:ADP-dependent NAD(P)H-hydrate dehydratase / NAD(P)H-hydrate epimerase
MIELLAPDEMAKADRLTIASGVTGIRLMENAGRAVADAVAARVAPGPVLIVAGPGNNGGDGFVAARLLSERGYMVRVMLLGDRAQLKGDAAEAATRWTGSVEPGDPARLGSPAIIVDALFGAGLARPIEGQARALIEAINGSGRPVVAVDLPSGINGATGQVMGVAIEAAETVTFFRRKPGHVLLPGREHCGVLKVADIGIPSAVLAQIGPRAFVNEPSLWRDRFPRLAAIGHKYDRGHAVVVSGGMPSTGAAKLAARGALRIGAGLVTIASPANALAAHAAESVAVMVREVDDAPALGEFLADKRRNAVVLGPGGGVGPRMRNQVATALRSGAAVVLDADALTSFAGEPEALAELIESKPERAVILTPHDGEFLCIFTEIYVDSNLHSKLEKTRAAVRETGAIVILKGGDSIVAEPGGRAAITANAPPTLATAGSGDVLAGMIAGLLAQHMPAFEAACAAVWLHGEAAREFGAGLISEDLPDMLPRVLRRLPEA